MALATTLSRRRAYYGWYIVGIAFLAQLISSGLAIHATAVWVRPMTQALGWSRTDFFWVTSFGSVLQGVLAFPLGPLVDRYGGRRLLILGALVAGGATMLTALVHYRWEFFLLRGILLPAGNLTMGYIVVSVAVSNWFIKKRGRAIAIAAMGLATASILLTPLAGVFINYLGWRLAWVALGLVVWVVIIPPAYLFMQRRPEDVGLLPDGGQTDTTPKAKPARPAEESYTRAQATRTPAFWLMTVAFALNSPAMGGMFFHFVPYLTGPPLNLSVLTATSVASVGGWFSFAIKPPWGLLGERVPARYLVAIGFVVMSGGILAITFARPLWAVYGAFMLWGVGMGGIAPMRELSFADAFGRLHLGAIRGLETPLTVLASAGAPLLAAWLYDVSGSYTSSFLIFAALSGIPTVLILLARPPRRGGG